MLLRTMKKGFLLQNKTSLETSYLLSPAASKRLVDR